MILARQLDMGVPRFTSMDPLAEKFYSWSPYVYCYNNPMRLTDPTGKDWWDVLYGISDAVTDNFTLGITGAVGANSVSKVSDASDYNVGRTVGDIISVIGGGIEIGEGVGTIAGGAAVSTTGAGALAGVPAIVIGATTTAHGAGVIGKALQGNGRMEASESNNSSSSSSSGSSKEVKTRPTAGKDGATSKHIIETDAKFKDSSGDRYNTGKYESINNIGLFHAPVFHKVRRLRSTRR